jgi:hypothetical protein
MKLKIASVLVALLIALGLSETVSAESILYKGKACLEIGNIKGKGSVTCEGEGGHCYGKAGCRFESGDTVQILLRFRNLALGKHTVTTNYGESHFSNNSESWSYWFSIKNASNGYNDVKVNLDGRYVGKVNFCVNCPLE